MKKEPAEQYIQAVSRAMFCTRKQKSDFVQQLSNDIDDYSDVLGHVPTWEELVAHFGTPSELAGTYMQSAGLPNIVKANFQGRVLLCVILCVVVLLSIFIILYIIDHHKKVENFHNGYEVETRYETVYTEDGLPPDDFYEGAIETVTTG